MSEKFDIKKHIFFDSDIKYSHRCRDDIYLDINGIYGDEECELSLFLTKVDVIALAKEFKLTAEELE